MGRSRKWTLNERFFETIDTQEKAYFLGLLYADGYNNVKGNYVALALKTSDMQLLVRLREIVESDSPLYKRDASGFAGSTGSFCLQMNSMRMCADLERHGCVQCKSDVIRFPLWLRRSLRSHFIRGFFDGDGGLSREVGKLKRSPGHIGYRFNIISNPLFIDDLNKIFKEELGRTYYVQRSPEKLKTTQIQIGGSRSIQMLLDWLYKDATVFLDRKYIIYQQLCARKNLAVREVYVYKRDTNTLIGHFPSYVAASLGLGVDVRTIFNNIHGKNRSRHFLVLPQALQCAA